MARFDPVKLKSLLEVERRGSIAAAARRLSLTPSAVSQHLSALERAAGTELLKRSAGGARLTATGRLVARHAATIEEALRAVEHDLASPLSTVELRIGFFPSIAPVFGAAVADLEATWPSCAISAVETAPEDARRNVLVGDLDAAVTVDWPEVTQPRSAELQEETLVIEPLLIAHSSEPHGTGDGLERFARSPWIAAFANTGCGASLRAACRRAGFDPDIRHQTNDFHAAAELVRATNAVTVIPSLLHGLLPRGVSTSAGPGLDRRILVVARPSAHPAVGELTASLRAHFSQAAAVAWR